MKVGRNVHAPKSNQMKKKYRRYIEKLDYQPTVDESIDFKETNQSGIDFSAVDLARKRPSNLSEKIKEHFLSNWLAWILGIIAVGILYLISDSKVAFTRFETMLATHNEKLNDLKSTDNDLKENDRSQDLKIQENRILLDQIKKDVSQTEMKIDTLMDPKQRN